MTLIWIVVLESLPFSPKTRNFEWVYVQRVHVKITESGELVYSRATSSKITNFEVEVFKEKSESKLITAG